ncbi:MAG: hypothetical protein JO199_10210 [Candidatus Eremiobacteraeota bacterium]|nr:hypothetical protein [Candidatus Eremiobacteraeota bacterium]
MYVQPFEGALAQGPYAPLGDLGDGAMPFSPPPILGGLGNDGISRLLPPLAGAATQFSLQSSGMGPLASILQQLVQMLQSMLGSAGGAEQYFGNASGASEGDPHLSFNGNHWTSMAAQPDLLQSNSIPGGFQISTQVTAPNAKGVSWNRSATVSLDGGATSVSLDDSGRASIVDRGRAESIAPGQTLQLGGGASVTCNPNGSLAIGVSNGQGGTISTTLTNEGPGVNVNVSAQNVDLGGSLVQGENATPLMPSLPLPSPLPFVHFTPGGI